MVKDIVVAILWAVAVWRLPAARGSSIKRSLWLAIASLAAALTVDLPPIALRIDHWSGLVALSTLLKHLIGILSCTAVLDWVLALTRPANPGVLQRFRYPIAAATALCLIVMFFIIPRRESNDFSSAEAGVTTAAVYLIIFEVYLGVAMATVCRVCWGAAKEARRGFLRSGLWLLSSGTLLGVGYAVARCVLMTITLAQGHDPQSTHIATQWTDRLQALAIILILLGTSVPAAEVAWRAFGNYRTLAELRPLWRQLSDAMPSVILGQAPSPRDDATAVRDLGFRLSRRVIEIRDATLLLREYATDDVADQARAHLAASGLEGEQLEAAVEACWLSVAVRAKARGAKANQGMSAAVRGGADLASESRWLCLVARAWPSPAVRAAVAVMDEPRAAIEESGATS